jgi:hypothetical protein
MPSAPHAQRSNVIGRALAHIRNVFTSDIGIIRAVWLRMSARAFLVTCAFAVL